MTKIIKVDSCGECPLHAWDEHDLDFKCVYGIDIADLGKIHPDCPLEDYEEKKEE